MSALDLLVGALMVFGMLSGWRLGVLGRASTWLGLAVGLLVASPVAARLAGVLAADRRGLALVVVGVVLVLGALLGQLLGALATSCLAPFRAGGTAGVGERVAGAAVGAAGVLALVWVLVPMLERIEILPRELVRASPIVSGVGDLLPAPPDPLGDALAGHPAQELLADVDQVLAEMGPPPDALPSRAVLDRAGRAVVSVVAWANCRPAGGTGVRIEDFVVTAAHVITGADRIELETPSGLIAVADIVLVDADRDLAVLSASGIAGDEVGLPGDEVGLPGDEVGLPGDEVAEEHTSLALPLALARPTAARDDEGAVLAFPPGETGVEVLPARVEATLDAAWSNRAARAHHVVAARVEHGMSGGPLVDRHGNVAGITVAKLGADAGLVVTGDEVAVVLAQARALAGDPTGGVTVEGTDQLACAER